MAPEATFLCWAPQSSQVTASIIGGACGIPKRDKSRLVRVRRVSRISSLGRRRRLAIQVRRRRATIALLHVGRRRIRRPGGGGTAIVLHWRGLGVPRLRGRRTLGISRRRGLVGTAGSWPHRTLPVRGSGSGRHAAAASVSSDVGAQRPTDRGGRVAILVVSELVGVV